MPANIGRPDYADHLEGYPVSEQKLKGNTYVRQLDDDEIESLRVACKLGREVLDEGFKAVAAGVSTDEVDRIVHEATVDRECYPSPLNYYQFPKSCCTSVNEVICHGIPDKRPLQVRASLSGALPFTFALSRALPFACAVFCFRSLFTCALPRFKVQASSSVVKYLTFQARQNLS